MYNKRKDAEAETFMSGKEELYAMRGCILGEMMAARWWDFVVESYELGPQASGLTFPSIRASHRDTWCDCKYCDRCGMTPEFSAKCTKKVGPTTVICGIV